ncbi:hypothetical protein HanPI659440_Chr05g0195341 [Helianthus annuus]|nr:hypothetical protein HanPI659440_Chr05g0195341 [Helianthus annuus]
MVCYYLVGVGFFNRCIFVNFALDSLRSVSTSNQYVFGALIDEFERRKSSPESVVVGFFSKNVEDARIVPVVWPFKGKGIFVISHPLNRENKLKLDTGTIREQNMKSWRLFR